MQQLSSLTLRLRPTSPLDGACRPWSLGPFLQGALMERVDANYAAALHQLPYNPYSQYCLWEGNELVWRVSALTDEACERVIEPLRRAESVELRAVGTVFEVAGSSLESLTLKALLATVSEPAVPKVRLRFVTPCAFKSQGEYQIMPSVRLVVQSLLMHYGQVYSDSKEGYAETVEYVATQARISSYDLRSQYFANVASGGRGIPSFTGTMTVTMRGPEMARGLVRMLLRFGEFAGVGIKTSMGMGGLRVLS